MKNEILAKFLNKIKRLKPKISAIYLFGSRARGIFRPENKFYELASIPSPLLENILKEGIKIG